MTSTHLRSADEPVPASGAGASFRKPSSGLSRRTLVTGAAWSVPAVAFATATPAFAASVACNPGTHSTVGRGKLLSGSLFSINLDTLASVNGVLANSPAPRVSATGFDSAPAVGNPDDTFSNTLSISALSAIQISATGTTNGTVTPILSGLLPATVGAHNQYSFASSQGLSKGASGVVVNNGDTALTPNASYPDFGTLELKTLLTPLLTGAGATALAAIGNIQLQIGAIAGRAKWDVCASPALLSRDYLVNHLRLVITSGLLADLTTLIVNTLNTALAVQIGLGRVTITPKIITEGSNGASPIPSFANPALPLPAGATQPIQANLGSTTTANGIDPGTIVVDLATLMGSGSDPFGASVSPYLNGLPANSILFVDNSLTVPGNAVSNFIGKIPTTPAGTDGYGLLGGLWTRLLDAIALNVGPYNGTLRGALSSGNGAVSALVNTVLGILNTLFSVTLTTAVSNIDALLNNVFGWLSGTINITLNVQNVPSMNNSPSTAQAHNGPAAWNFAPRYDVAAIGVNAVSGNALAIYLARGSVGPNA